MTDVRRIAEIISKARDRNAEWDDWSEPSKQEFLLAAALVVEEFKENVRDTA